MRQDKQDALKVVLEKIAMMENLERGAGYLLSAPHRYFQYCASLAHIDFRSKRQMKVAAEIFLNFLEEWGIEILPQSKAYFERTAGISGAGKGASTPSDARAAELYHEKRGGI